MKVLKYTGTEYLLCFLDMLYAKKWAKKNQTKRRPEHIMNLTSKIGCLPTNIYNATINSFLLCTCFKSAKDTFKCQITQKKSMQMNSLIMCLNSTQG